MKVEVPLDSEEVRRILCYPRCDEEEYKRRIKELKGLGISALISEGKVRIGRMRVLGKGCVSIVVLAKDKEGNLRALKIRRTDSNREDLLREAGILRRINDMGIGPKLYGFSRNVLVMEYVEGEGLKKWLLSNHRRYDLIRYVLRELLDQCFKLDRANIIHKELSMPEGHVIVRRDTLRPCLLDFETVSLKSRKRNLTQLAGYLFFKEGEVSKVVKRALGLNESKLIELRRVLKEYKGGKMEGAYRELLSILKL